MNINRRKVKRYLPPALIEAARWLKQCLIYADWEYVAQGWKYSNPKLKGWNIDEVVTTQVEKWDRFCEAIKCPSNFAVNHETADYTIPDLFSHNVIVSFNYVCALSARNISKLRLLDWGGGIGHYGRIIAEALPDVEVEYSNYDLDVFATPFKDLFPQGSFISSKADLTGKYDLINISSSLWYDENWKQTLHHLSEFAAKYIYITRMIFIKNKPSYVAIQRPYSEGYNTEYLCWIFNEHEIISFMQSLGFSLMRSFYLGDAPTYTGAPEQGIYSGFLFKKRNQSTS